MKKIKLLYGLEAAGGGALKHLVYLVTRLNREIFDITVILSNSRKENISDEIQKMKDAGARIILMPMSRNINILKDLTLFFRLVFFLKKNRHDIIHAHSSKAGGLFRIAGWFCKIPSIYYTPHCFYFQGKKGVRKTVFVLFERILAKITSGIIVSESEQKEIIENKIAATSKAININNAIDFDEYHQSKEVTETRTSFGIKKNVFIVGAIGRLAHQKDWETYVYAADEVLKTYPETVFLIVGDGELRTEIQKLVFKLNLEDNIILTGHVKEIHKIYGIIDVFVNTSLWEGLPYVFLEAMKYKKPIIATNTGNETTIIHEENGFISPVKDYHSIAGKITRLIENKQLAVQMGEKGNHRVTRKYSFELFIQKHELLYKNGLLFTPGKSDY